MGTRSRSTTAQAARSTGCALVRANTATHGVNFDQRYVAIDFLAVGRRGTDPGAPVSGSEAPPGWYMLFVMDDGVPSVASWVHISGS